MHLANLYKAATVIAVLPALAACATAPSKPPEQIVTERAKARWEALLAKDYDTAYSFYSPGYRSSHTLEGFELQQNAARIRISDATFNQIACQERICRPVFYIHYQVTSPIPMVGEIESSTRIEEQWLLEDGTWWYVPEDPGRS